MTTESEREALKSVLRARGLRMTHARIAVLEALRGMDGHRSAQEISAAIAGRYPAINAVTVYRTLELFEAHNLAVRAILGDGTVRWEWPAPAHHHVLCRRCGALMEVPAAPFQRLADDLAANHGVHVEVRHLIMHGLCAACIATPA